MSYGMFGAERVKARLNRSNVSDRGATLKVVGLTSDSKWGAENTALLVTLCNLKSGGG